MNAQSGNRFPSTHWSLLAAVRGPLSVEHRAALDQLVERYRYPAYLHIRNCGFNRDEAEDLVQEFFTNWLHRGLFGRADVARGRFRDFFLTSLDNFLKNARRNQHVQRRWPAGGFADDEVDRFADLVTPDTVFFRAYQSELIRSVLAELDEECRGSGKAAHYGIFQRRIVEPALDGATPPPMRQLATLFGMSEKQASNCLVTVKRAFKRLLYARVRDYAAPGEDVDLEIAELQGHLRLTGGE